jgi:hypothetical protein|nr:MAG TPA: hypothetical protein [Crassvirales sp.]
MRKLIHVVMRVSNCIAVPDVAFNSDKEAEEYGKQKYDANRDYKWYISQVYLEDKEQK